MPAASFDRRAEAHLWLLLEEALLAARRGTEAAWEAWRNHRAVAAALVAVEALHPAVADALTGELDDALAVRGLLPLDAFSASPWPTAAVAGWDGGPPVGAGAIWLEAEIERHLDLFVSFPRDRRAAAATDMARILEGPVRALVAVGALPPDGGRLLEALAATLGAARGLTAVEGDQPFRDDWLGFLRSEPPPLPAPHHVDARHRTAAVVGELADAWVVRVDEVAWSADALDLSVVVRRTPGAAPSGLGIGRMPWHVRAADDLGHLHLGQPFALTGGRSSAVVSLRPGPADGVRSLQVRVTVGGRRCEGWVTW